MKRLCPCKGEKPMQMCPLRSDEKMDDSQLASNASAVIAAIEKKLPQGDKNISNALIKFSMGKAVRLRSLKEKEER